MGDPLRPLARLSAPLGHGRLAPPLRHPVRVSVCMESLCDLRVTKAEGRCCAEGREVARVRSEGLQASERSRPQPVVLPRHGRLKPADCFKEKREPARRDRASGFPLRRAKICRADGPRCGRLSPNDRDRVSDETISFHPPCGRENNMVHYAPSRHQEATRRRACRANRA